MSPRWGGVTLMSVSIMVGALAGWAMADARWSIVAALALTAATVGMGVGALWLRRRSWKDKTWPPAAPERSDAARMQRTARVSGIVLLSCAPIVIALLIWAVADRDVEWGRIVFMVIAAVLYAAFGIMLLRRGSTHGTTLVPHATHADRPVNSAGAGKVRDGWRPLGLRSGAAVYLAAAGSSSMPAVVLMALLLLQLLSRVSDSLLTLFIWLAILVVALATGFVVLRRSAPRVFVDETKQRIRAGRREAAWAELTSAQLLASSFAPGPARTLVVVLRDDHGLRASVMLRHREALSLTHEETELALRVIDASAIDLPRAKEDPRGKFSRQLFPSHLTKSQVRDVIDEPPAAADALPVGSPPA